MVVRSIALAIIFHISTKHHAQTQACRPRVCANSSSSERFVTAYSCAQKATRAQRIESYIRYLYISQSLLSSLSIFIVYLLPSVSSIDIFKPYQSLSASTSNFQKPIQENRLAKARTSPIPSVKMQARNIFAFLSLAVMAMSAAIPAAVPAPDTGMPSKHLDRIFRAVS